MRFHSISNKIFNIYSKEDYILKYLFKLKKYHYKPCGLNKITSMYDHQKKVKNFDLTDFIKGHGEYTK